MSWSYSRALVEEFSAQCFSDTGLSALLNTTPTPDQSYWPDKTTEHSRLSRFGMTLEHLMGIRGEELLTWYLAASRAKTLALPEAGPDWTAKGQGYGEKWLGLLGKYDPDTHSLKTAQLSLLGDSDESSPTLPRWGLMLAGELFPQPIPALITSEKGSGYWPTPTAMLGASDLNFRCSGDGRKKPNKLGWAVAEAAVKMWPTPTVCGNYNRPGASATSGMGLATAVKTWPTPCASASKGSSPAALIRKDGKNRSGDRLDHAVMSLHNGQLNPEWTEWLMGWPIGHTGLRPLGTGRFLEFMRQHSGCFSEVEYAKQKPPASALTGL